MSGDVDAMTPSLVEHEPGDELELVGEDVLAIHHAVAVGVGQDRDGVLGIARLRERLERAGVPRRCRVRHASAVGILGRFRHPQPALLVPIDVHRLGDERLGGDERQVELGVHLDLRGGLRRRGRAAFGVAQRVAELVLLHQLVDVGALAGPRDAAQQDRAVVGAVEVLVEVSGDRDEGAIRRAAAVDGLLVGPHLRLDVVDADLLAAARQLVGAALEVGVARARRPSACRPTRGRVTSGSMSRS